MSGVDKSSTTDRTSDTATSHDIDTALAQAKSLDGLREYVLEVSGDFDDSPFEDGTQVAIERLTRLSRNAADNIPLTARRTQSLLDGLPVAISRHARRLYESQLSSNGDIDYEV
jgi:hypothetical protein